MTVGHSGRGGGGGGLDRCIEKELRRVPVGFFKEEGISYDTGTYLTKVH